MVAVVGDDRLFLQAQAAFCSPEFEAIVSNAKFVLKGGTYRPDSLTHSERLLRLIDETIITLVRNFRMVLRRRRYFGWISVSPINGISLRSQLRQHVVSAPHVPLMSQR